MGDISYRPLIEDMTFSYSRLNSYESCPYCWKLTYLDEKSRSQLFYSSFGGLVHDIIAKYYKGELEKNEMTAEFLTRFLTEVKGIRPSASIVEKYINQGVRYFNNFTEFGLNTIAVEDKVDFKINEIPMTGIIDYIGEKDGKYYCIDHKSHELKPKSGKLKPTKKDLELDNYLRQLYLYSTAIKEKYGEFPSELWFNCFRSGILIKEQFDPHKYDEAISWAADLTETIKSDTDFDANYDYFYCRWICDQAYNCEIFEEELYGE